MRERERPRERERERERTEGERTEDAGADLSHLSITSKGGWMQEQDGGAGAAALFSLSLSLSLSLLDFPLSVTCRVPARGHGWVKRPRFLSAGQPHDFPRARLDSLLPASISRAPSLGPPISQRRALYVVRLGLFGVGWTPNGA
uniref:Uncharacterized protein n=1 Tax=Arundo donax TaxID=35708 RepID=A0A0A9FZY7_ARUDO